MHPGPWREDGQGHPGQKGSWGCPGWALTGRGWAAGGRFGTRGPRHSGGPGQGRNPCSSRTHYSWLGEPSRRRLRSLQTLRPGRETECPVLPRACPGPSGPGPPPLEAPPHLGGGQLQVENRFRPGKQLDLLHQMHSAVPAHDSLVQGARGCGETELPMSALGPRRPFSSRPGPDGLPAVTRSSPGAKGMERENGFQPLPLGPALQSPGQTPSLKEPECPRSPGRGAVGGGALLWASMSPAGSKALRGVLPRPPFTNCDHPDSH